MIDGHGDDFYKFNCPITFMAEWTFPGCKPTCVNVLGR